MRRIQKCAVQNGIDFVSSMPTATLQEHRAAMIPTLPLFTLTTADRRSRRLSFIKKTENMAQTPAADSEEPILPAMSLLAEEVEFARQHLQILLLQTPQSRIVFSKAIEQHLQQGFLLRELMLDDDSSVENGTYSESDTDMFNDDADLESLCGVVRLVTEDMSNRHFLPTFLLHVAQVLLEPRLSASILPTSYHCQLQRASKALSSKRQQMIDGNLGLVAFIARKHKATQISFEDLMQEGIVGLIKAVDRFDYQRNIRFSTYATYWIKQAINRLSIKQDKIVRLPVALAEKAPSLFEVMRECYLQQQRWPTLEELKTKSSLSEDDIKTISSYYQATHSLDTPNEESEDDDGLALMEKLTQQQFALPLDSLVAQNLIHYVNKALDSLPDKEASILIMRFGLQNHPEMTLQAVADQLHVTRERVRQIQNEALKKLKQQFGFDLMLFLEPND